MGVIWRRGCTGKLCCLLFCLGFAAFVNFVLWPPYYSDQKRSSKGGFNVRPETLDGRRKNSGKPRGAGAVAAVKQKDKELFYDNVLRAGENGVPVVVDKKKLNETHLLKYKRGYKLHDFNEYVSNLISLRRKIPDGRNKKYGYYNHYD